MIPEEKDNSGPLLENEEEEEEERRKKRWKKSRPKVRRRYDA